MTSKQHLDDFWAHIATTYLDWQTPWHTVSQGDFNTGNIHWFLGGQLNVSVNCLDRHLPAKAQQLALIWEGDSEQETRSLTFEALYREVCRMANVLLALGIGKGSRVALYLPMIPEAAIAMLACTRIGAVHTVVFAGFSAKALRQRLQAAQCQLLITADGYERGGKSFSLKPQADEASSDLTLPRLVIQHHHTSITFDKQRDHWWHELRETVSDTCQPAVMFADDPLFILYTSGSTGAPKGIVHTTGGYLTQVAYSYQYIFDCQANDIFWCTADIGWITGHSYLIYGPLCHGITTLMYAGIPTWPDPARCWRMIDKYHVTIFYTAPTTIRALKQAGNDWLANSSRLSLRLLGSVGEPINPEVWQWYHQQVGLARCQIVDTWWQTETGAIMISATYNQSYAKPGSACQPLPGIYPVLLDEDDQEITGVGSGALAIKYSWPSLARTIANDHQRYCATYFRNGYYITGDGAKRDAEGDYWLMGRIDDVVNVAGHRLGTAEIESALVAHPAIAEAAVVGVPHELKGQAIYAFVSLKQSYQVTADLQDELRAGVKSAIGSIAKPEVIQCVTDLPKTRSGKIMRRLLRLIASGQVRCLDDLGDVSTLANPEVLGVLLARCVKSDNTM